jgi:hypothetical protein
LKTWRKSSATYVLIPFDFPLSPLIFPNHGGDAPQGREMIEISR